MIMLATGTGIAPMRSYVPLLFHDKVGANPEGSCKFSGLACLFLGVPCSNSLLYSVRVSDAFCAKKPEKFEETQPQRGYLDQQGVLAAWKARELEPPTPRGGAAQPKPRSREIKDTTFFQPERCLSFLDQLGVKTFRGMATVSEMYGSVVYVRQHRIPLKQGKHSRGSQTRRRPRASCSSR